MGSRDFALEMPMDLHHTVSPLQVDDTPHATRKNAGITSLTVDIPSSYHGVELDSPKPPARWRTREFYLYYLVFAVAVPWMIWTPVSLSLQSHPNYNLYRHRLASGWLFGRKVDNSDIQYRSFRSNIPALLALLAAFFALKFIYTRSAIGPASATTEKTYLLPFYTIFSVLMLLILHGTSALKVFTILSINYAIAKAGGGSKWVVAATWIFNGGILFLNETYSGYTFAGLHPALSILDSLEGVYPRWHVSFNITMLRLVSFNMDHHWACNRAGTADSGNELTERQRKTTYHALDVYSYRNYLAYALYAPLYIAGPIMTFNDFMWQLIRPSESSATSSGGVARYAVRFLATLLTMEFVLHFMYVVAIKDTHAWGGDSAGQLSMIGFWNLVIVWLKLLLPWRFFRLWALLDGIDPPENMVRCVANNYSTLGFWRSWHRSYNLWLVRYIYIPLGGTRRVALSTILIFSFVALWHDLSFRLLAWGWLVSFFILPELLAKYLLPASKFSDKRWYRHVCALGAVCNVLMMMAANLVGFVLGTEGMGYMMREMGGSWAGLSFMVAACACLFVGVQVMFEYREEEMRRGIYRRC